VVVDQDDRASVIHKVFTGVNTDNYDLVADTLAEFERDASNQGHLRGFVVGLVIGAIIGVMVAGLPHCGEPDQSISSSANAASSGSSSFF
jgi:hypothetical protein